MWIQATGKYTTQDLESDRETDGAMYLLSTAEKQQFMNSNGGLVGLLWSFLVLGESSLSTKLDIKFDLSEFEQE